MNTSSPDALSVVVSTYNRTGLLGELLDSLRAQTLPADRFEVVVVDDGSREPVEPALAARADPFPVTVLRQDNAGPAAARHAGILAARHELIVITDDDMLVRPDFLERHLERHRAGATLVLGHIAYDGSLDDKPLFERFHALKLAEFVARYRARPTEVRGTHVCTGNVSFRRSAYLEVGGFDRSLGRSEDRDLGVRLEQAGARLHFAADAVTINRSDHTDPSVWRKRNFLYGVSDSRIHAKHPAVTTASPWHFIFVVHPVSRGLLLLSAAAPSLGGVLAGVTYRVSELVDRGRQVHPAFERAAIRGATLSYGLDYFRGVRDEAGSLTRAAGDLARHAWQRFTGGRP